MLAQFLQACQDSDNAFLSAEDEFSSLVAHERQRLQRPRISLLVWGTVDQIRTAVAAWPAELADLLLPRLANGRTVWVCDRGQQADRAVGESFDQVNARALGPKIELFLFTGEACVLLEPRLLGFLRARTDIVAVTTAQTDDPAQRLAIANMIVAGSGLDVLTVHLAGSAPARAGVRSLSARQFCELILRIGNGEIVDKWPEPGSHRPLGRMRKLIAVELEKQAAVNAFRERQGRQLAPTTVTGVPTVQELSGALQQLRESLRTSVARLQEELDVDHFAFKPEVALRSASRQDLVRETIDGSGKRVGVQSRGLPLFMDRHEEVSFGQDYLRNTAQEVLNERGARDRRDVRILARAAEELAKPANQLREQLGFTRMDALEFPAYSPTRLDADSPLDAPDPEKVTVLSLVGHLRTAIGKIQAAFAMVSFFVVAYLAFEKERPRGSPMSQFPYVIAIVAVLYVIYRWIRATKDQERRDDESFEKLKAKLLTSVRDAFRNQEADRNRKVKRHIEQFAPRLEEYVRQIEAAVTAHRDAVTRAQGAVQRAATALSQSLKDRTTRLQALATLTISEQTPAARARDAAFDALKALCVQLAAMP